MDMREQAKGAGLLNYQGEERTKEAHLSNFIHGGPPVRCVFVKNEFQQRRLQFAMTQEQLIH